MPREAPFGVRLSEEIRSQLKAIAQGSSTTPHAIVKQAVTDYLKNQNSPTAN